MSWCIVTLVTGGGTVYVFQNRLPHIVRKRCQDPVPTRLLRLAVGWGFMLAGVSYIPVKVPVRLVSIAENVSIDVVGGISGKGW